MKTSHTKTMKELKAELKLITSTEETWAIWCRLFDAHNNGDLVNPDTENTYKSDPKGKIPPILREFFRPLQGLTDSELYRAAEHILLETPRRSLPYPKIFLKRPKHMKPSTYHIRQWCECRKRKTMAIREMSKLHPARELANADGEIDWKKWRAFKAEYHINGVSMRALIREAAPFLAQRARMNEKKGSIDERETMLYLNFLDRKKKAKFGGVARFCTVGASNMVFGKWDTHDSRASVREDPRGCPFAIFDFRAFPGAWKQGTPEKPFYEPLLGAFKAFRSPALHEPNVWLWITEQEKSAVVVQLYNSEMKLQYDLYHSTYVPAKTEGITVVQEARGVK